MGEEEETLEVDEETFNRIKEEKSKPKQFKEEHEEEYPVEEVKEAAKEEDFECEKCGTKVTRNMKFCPTCKGELAW